MGGVGSRHFLVALTVGGVPQGLMATLLQPRRAELRADGDTSVLYVDYLEVAPWNLRDYPHPPRYLGCGTALLAEAVRLSQAVGLGGRVGLHSLPRAERFYKARHMVEVGRDPGYYDLMYFEYTEETAAGWVARLEENHDV